MHKRLNEFLEEETCFYSLQFGFRLTYSTNNALVSTAENIQTQMIVNMLQGFLLTRKKSLWYSYPWHTNWKTQSFWCYRGCKRLVHILPEGKETIFCDWKWNVNNSRNFNWSPARLSRRSTTFPYLDQWSEHLLQFSKIYHFADDTNIMHSNISLEVFGKTNERRSIKSIVLRRDFYSGFLNFFCRKIHFWNSHESEEKIRWGREGVDGIWGRRLIGLRNEDLPT